MARWRAHLPRYRTPIILQRYQDGPATGAGTQRRGSNLARVLKALSTVSPTFVARPTEPAPADHLVEPKTYATGWQAWWPDPPAQGQGYRIPDPPKIPRTALPTRTNPILWEAFAEVGTSVWNVRISAIYALCEWQPKTGKEQMSGALELSVQEAALKIRPNIVSIAGITAKEWNVLRVESGNEPWQLMAITPSFRRGEFVELMVKNAGR